MADQTEAAVAADTSRASTDQRLNRSGTSRWSAFGIAFNGRKFSTSEMGKSVDIFS